MLSQEGTRRTRPVLQATRQKVSHQALPTYGEEAMNSLTTFDYFIMGFAVLANVVMLLHMAFKEKP